MAKRLATVALFGMFLLTAFAVPSQAKWADVGDVAPEFTLPLLSGKTFNSAEFAKQNKTVVITFIQTACSACKGEIIALNKLAKKSKANVGVLPVAVDMRSGKDFLDNYKSENAVDFDFGMDPKFSVPALFGMSFTPGTVVISGGKIVKVFRGYDADIAKELEAVFEK